MPALRINELNSSHDCADIAKIVEVCEGLDVQWLHLYRSDFKQLPSFTIYDGDHFISMEMGSRNLYFHIAIRSGLVNGSYTNVQS